MTTEELFQLLLAAREKAPLTGDVLIEHDAYTIQEADAELYEGHLLLS